MSVRESVLRLLLVEDRVEDAERTASVLRNGGTATHAMDNIAYAGAALIRSRFQEAAAALLGTGAGDLILKNIDAIGDLADCSAIIANCRPAGGKAL